MYSRVFFLQLFQLNPIWLSYSNLFFFYLNVLFICQNTVCYKIYQKTKIYNKTTVTQTKVTNMASRAQAQAFLPSCFARVNLPASNESSDFTAKECFSLYNKNKNIALTNKELYNFYRISI